MKRQAEQKNTLAFPAPPQDVHADILETLQDVVWSISLTDNKLLYVNSAVENLFGRQASEFYEDPALFLSCVVKEHYPLIVEDQKTAISKGIAEGTYQLCRPDGEIRWINVRMYGNKDSLGRPVRLEGVIRDVTDRRRMEDRLRETTDRFRQVAENMQEVFWMSNLMATEFYYVSPGVEKIWGVTAKQVINDAKVWHRSIHPDDRDVIARSIENAVRSEGSFDVQYRIIRPDGGVRWVWARAFVATDGNGKPSRFSGIASDITKQKETEKLVAQQRERITASSKMSALGEMAGGIAHEINNPLAIIQLKSEQLIDMLESDDPDKEGTILAARKIEQTVMRISKIVKALRSFARDGERDPFETSSVKMIIDETIELCRERFKNKSIQLEIEPYEEEIVVECRPVQICQVLLNLLNNAYDAVDDSAEKKIRIKVKNWPSSVELSVEDSGIGIKPDHVDKVFQPFFTTKDVDKGTGMGLSVSKGIVESHKGRLKFDASASWTRFVIELPKKQS